MLTGEKLSVVGMGAWKIKVDHVGSLDKRFHVSNYVCDAVSLSLASTSLLAYIVRSKVT